MTAIVGVLCHDGIVIGSDSSTTFTHGNMRTIEQKGEKIEIVESRVIVAGTGPIGLGQRFCNIVKNTWNNNEFKGNAMEVCKGLSKAYIQDFHSTFLNKNMYGALVAFPCEQKLYLCEFDTEVFQPELKTNNIWYCSMGSSQPITDPFLALIREIYWKEDLPSVNEAIFAVTWTLDHAVQINPGGVNGPVKIATLQKVDKSFEARKLDEHELDEHRQCVEDAKTTLRELRARLNSNNTPNLPTPPR